MIGHVLKVLCTFVCHKVPEAVGINRHKVFQRPTPKAGTNTVEDRVLAVKECIVERHYGFTMMKRVVYFEILAL